MGLSYQFVNKLQIWDSVIPFDIQIQIPGIYLSIFRKEEETVGLLSY